MKTLPGVALLIESSRTYGRGIARYNHERGPWSVFLQGGEMHRGIPAWLKSWQGGGVKRGCIYGSSDDFAYHVAENPVQVHDLQATLMHLCGINHERFTYKHQGRDFRLTDVHGKVVNGVLAV